MKRPIRHKFKADELHPTWCAHCGCREDQHVWPVTDESLAEWQSRVAR